MEGDISMRRDRIIHGEGKVGNYKGARQDPPYCGSQKSGGQDMVGVGRNGQGNKRANWRGG